MGRLSRQRGGQPPSGLPRARGSHVYPLQGAVGAGRSPFGQPGSSPGPGSRPRLSGTLNAALAGPAAGGGHWWPLMGPACVVTRTGALPSFGGLSRAASHSCRVPCPRGSSRWVDRRGWGARSGDTHVRGVPRPTSGGNDNVLGRKQSLGRNRGSLGHPGTPRAPSGTSRGLHRTQAQPLPVAPAPQQPRDGSEHRQESFPAYTASPGRRSPEAHKAMPGWAA